MKYIVCKTDILDNGKKYKQGSIIELEESNAAKLHDYLEPIQNQADQNNNNIDEDNILDIQEENENKLEQDTENKDKE